MKISKPIVFFGSGLVAAQSLEFISRNFNIEAVITKPKKSNSRDPVPVIDLSNKLGVKVYTPTNKDELDYLLENTNFNSEVGILIDYGIIVSQKVINSFKLGIINSHFSLLPAWRGPDPISFSILNGDKTTGVSLMLLSIGIDEGKLIAQEKTNINNSNCIVLTESLIKLSNSMLTKYMPNYLSGDLVPYAQSDKISPSFSRKLTKQDGIINWSKPAIQIESEIRAFISWPKSFTKIYGIPVIITQAAIGHSNGEPGSITYDKKSMNINCKKDSLNVLRLKPVGKNDMEIASFISGYANQFVN